MDPSFPGRSFSFSEIDRVVSISQCMALLGPWMRMRRVAMDTTDPEPMLHT
jgi:hypothetical protein